MITVSIRKTVAFLIIIWFLLGSVTLSIQANAIQVLSAISKQQEASATDSMQKQISYAKLDAKQLLKTEQTIAIEKQTVSYVPTGSRFKGSRRNMVSIPYMAIHACSMIHYYEQYQSGVCGKGKQDTSNYRIIQYIQLQDGKK